LRGWLNSKRKRDKKSPGEQGKKRAAPELQEREAAGNNGRGGGGKPAIQDRLELAAKYKCSKIERPLSLEGYLCTPIQKKRVHKTGTGRPSRTRKPLKWEELVQTFQGERCGVKDSTK